MKSVLVVYAVKEEFVPITLANCDVQYLITGIGKSNAAMKLTKSIMSNNFDLILNIGTVGTVDREIGEILICNRFVDRDLLPLVDYGVTAEIELSQIELSTEFFESWGVDNRKMVTCNTGDTFISDLSKELKGDVVDMEAFALASVCKEFELPFISIKYITDIIGQNSVEHWEAKLQDARIAIEKWFLSK